MRCHPLRWLWGLLPLAVWTWVTVLSERPRIEADLAKRSHEALQAAGLDWAHVSFSGRDGIISGKASEDSEPTAALRTVNNSVWGVRIADTQAELIEKVDTYLWSATLHDDDTIRLTGYVPNEATRRAVLAAVKADFPRAKIDDRTKLARGAPDNATWIAGIKFAAKQLTGLKKGHVDLSGTGLSVVGEAQSVPTYGSIKTALAGGLPKGWKLVADRVTPPVVSPYLWSAHHSGEQVTLTGYVPDERTREAVVAHAQKSFRKVVDKLQLAEGAPEGLQRAANAALDQLVNLKNGKADLKGHAFALSGEASDQDAANAIRGHWKSALPHGFQSADNLTFPDNSAQLAAEAKRRADEEARRAAEAADAKRRAEEADAKRRSEEANASADAKRRADEEARRAAEETRRANEAAEAKRREEAEAKRRADEADAKRRGDEERKAEASRCEQALRTVSRDGVIRFERASADLHSDSRPTLDKLVKAANACPGLKIEIEGHTDAEGTPERNKRLSERRAQSIVGYLTNAGVDANRLDAVGYGETRPIAPNDTPENRAKNRRIEFSVKPN